MKKRKKRVAPTLLIMVVIFLVGVVGSNNKNLLKSISDNEDIVQMVIFLETSIKFPFLNETYETLQQSVDILTQAESNFVPEYPSTIQMPLVREATNYPSTVSVTNQTSKTYDATELFNSEQNLGIEFNSDEPQILLVCTHATESYAKQDDQDYEESSEARTLDTEYNVIKVAETLAEYLNDNQINTVYATEIHDYPSYTGSYDFSRLTIQDYLEKYPSIKITIDIHRDAILTDSGTHLKALTEIDGVDYAQIMLVLGTNDGGLEHDDWEQNLALALQLQQSIEGTYDDFMRNLNLRTSRYNQDLGQYAFLLECGTSGNTLEEALRSIELFGEEFIKFIKGST